MSLSDRVICIGYPSSELIDVRFHTDLFAMATQSAAFCKVGLTNAVGSRIVANRNIIVDNARQLGATDILWIDTDSKFPVDALLRLLSQKKDIICATTSRRSGGDHSPIGILEDPASVAPYQKLVPMRIVGFPFMLVSMSVFDKMEKPYFAEPPRKMAIEKYGTEYFQPYYGMDEHVVPEDEYFCTMARMVGYEILADMELSMEIGHIGSAVNYIEQPQPQSQINSPSPNVDIAFGANDKTISDEQFHRAQDGHGE